jgi:TctA family transporter
MDLLSNLALGFGTAASPLNLLYCFIGCLFGTLVGVLPGLGPAATVAMLLPITFTMEPTTALIMLAGIYYGAQYGGSTSAILVNLPGEVSSVVTALDGYKMARQGKAGLALSTAAIGSFVAGSIATLVLAALAPFLAGVALSFQAPEYFTLMLLGLIATLVLAQGSVLKSGAVMVFGLVLGTVGIDLATGVPRLTSGYSELADGFNIVAVAMGMYGLAEIVWNLHDRQSAPSIHHGKLRNLLPSRQDVRAIVGPILRGTGIGAALGILPGGGAMMASFASYAVEKRIADDPSRFGNGAIEGVAGPESANNAGAQTSFIPLLTLGIPSNAVMALMAGALIIQGIQPSPAIMREQPELFWGLIASMWIGNLMLLVLNLPMVGLWARLITMPYRFLFPSILVFCSIGVFTLSNNTFDLYVMVAFGLIGYLLRRLECEPTPLLLGLIIGPMLEEYFNRAMRVSQGDFLIFLSRPISATLLALALVAVLAVALPAVRRRRNEAFQE